MNMKFGNGGKQVKIEEKQYQNMPKLSFVTFSIPFSRLLLELSGSFTLFHYFLSTLCIKLSGENIYINFDSFHLLSLLTKCPLFFSFHRFLLIYLDFDPSKHGVEQPKCGSNPKKKKVMGWMGCNQVCKQSSVVSTKRGSIGKTLCANGSLENHITICTGLQLRSYFLRKAH